MFFIQEIMNLLIRGGHNFNTLTFSDEPVSSNDSKIDILVCLDSKNRRIA